MRSLIEKRSVIIDGHKTSVSLEDAFWDGIKEIAEVRGMTLSGIVTEVDGTRRHNNLSSALRLLVLDFERTKRKSAESALKDARGFISETLVQAPIGA